MDNDEAIKEELGELLKGTFRRESAIHRIKQGVSLGLILRQQVSDLRFDGIVFYTVLGMSILKDFLDAITLSLTAWLTWIPITVGLQIFFFLRKSVLKRFIIKNFLWKYLAISFMEMLPGTSFFPGYTLATIFLKRSVEKERRKLKSEAEEVDRAVSNMRVPRDE